MTATHTGALDGQDAVRSVSSCNSRKVYYEMHIDAKSANNITIGWMDSSHSLTNRVGEDGSNVGVGWWTAGRLYRDGGFVTLSGTAGTDDYVQVAVDFATGDIWFGINNSWLGSGSPDPATGTDPNMTETEFTSGDYYIAATLYDKDPAHVVTIRTSQSEMEGTIPTGFVCPDDYTEATTTTTV